VLKRSYAIGFWLGLYRVMYLDAHAFVVVVFCKPVMYVGSGWLSEITSLWWDEQMTPAGE
jgi:hypothetical protein